jgi:hypothetical protein
MSIESLYEMEDILTQEILEKHDINLVVKTVEDAVYRLSKQKEPPLGIYTIDLAPKSLEIIRQVRVSRLLFYQGTVYERVMQFLEKEIMFKKGEERRLFLYYLIFYFEMKLRALCSVVVDTNAKLVDEITDCRDKIACRFEYGDRETYMTVYFNRKLEERKSDKEKFTGADRLLDFTEILLSGAQTNSRILSYIKEWQTLRKKEAIT